MNIKRFLKSKRILIPIFDLIFVFLAAFLAIWVQDETFSMTMGQLLWTLMNVAFLFSLYTLFSLYSFSFSGISVIDAMRISVAVWAQGCLNVLISLMWGGFFDIGLRAAVVFTVFLFITTGGMRFSKRIYKTMKNSLYRDISDRKRVMVIGAGDAGMTLVREMLYTDKIKYYPVCIIDDSPKKIGTSIMGVRVVGDTYSISHYASVFEVEEILVAMPSVPAPIMKDIVSRANATGMPVKVLPGIYQLADGQVSVSKLRHVEIEDLLGRPPVNVNLDEIMGYIENKVVLVTGGGGSIGSELCRQIATHSPKLLIILDIYENNAYEIEQELRRKHPDLKLIALIASVRDNVKIRRVFEEYRPNIVFNAAAHKHVPLMETSPNEAVKNNVFGTLNVARAADDFGTETFVQISTDKAVNPTNIMGATKRICEMIIQTIGRHSKNTNFVAVRFGNVLGSNGSVIPLFKRQIAEGGPVTVTHRDIIRYFMTIPEAVSLVLQAGAYAKGGQIFVLDMGEPIKIYDLARNLVILSGLKPDVDIEIKFTGLRPGEKLYEERLMEEEGLQRTENGLISIARPIPLDEDNLFTRLEELYTAAHAETDEMKELVRALVPTYVIDKRSEIKEKHSV